MSYYHLPTSTERSPGRLEQKLSDGAWLSPPDTGWTQELAALCGFVPVVTTTRPADTSTQTSDRSVVVADGVPTEQWTVRAKTQGELDADTAAANNTTIRSQAQTALQTNADALALPNPTSGNNTYLAIGSPTNAQVAAQVRALTQQNNALVAQVRALTQQNSKLIRLALGLFDGTD
jgi:hypothetical protein